MYKRRFNHRLIGTQWASLNAALIKWRARDISSPYTNVWSSRLARFMDWCAAAGIAAEFVDDDVVMRYLREATSGKKRLIAYKYAKALRATWNHAVCVVPGWPAAWVALETPRGMLPAIRGETIVSFADEDFHPALVTEVDFYCKSGGLLYAGGAPMSSMTHRDRMALRLDKFKNAPPIPGPKLLERRPARLSPDRTYAHRRTIFQTATALYLAGLANLDDLRSIRDVITPHGAAVLAESMQERHVHEDTVALCVMSFLNIARRCGIELSPGESIALRELWLDISPEVCRRAELCERSLVRLAQFDDRDKFASLIALPDVLMDEVEDARRRNDGRPTRDSARQARSAVAIEILNTLPVRRGSLVAIDIKRNIIPNRGMWPLLIFYPDQVKTRRTLEVRLSQRTWRLISLYCKHYRPMLPGADQSTLLFPGASTKPTAPVKFAMSVCDVVRKRLGVTMNVNLWRHVLATKVAEMRGATEDGARLLGHAPGSHSIGYYVRIGSRIAAKWASEITDEVRPRGIELLTGRSSDRQ